MLWDVKHVQHDIPQSTTIHGNIWTLEVGCNPVGKRSRRFYGRRLNTSKSKIRPFTKNQVLKIYRHQANTRSWKNFYTWPGFVTTFTKLSSHYGWSLHHKAEQPLRMTTTSQGWAAITVDHYTHTHTHKRARTHTHPHTHTHTDISLYYVHVFIFSLIISVNSLMTSKFR